jgi:hypothetical protein
MKKYKIQITKEELKNRLINFYGGWREPQDIKFIPETNEVSFYIYGEIEDSRGEMLKVKKSLFDLFLNKVAKLRIESNNDHDFYVRDYGEFIDFDIKEKYED